MARAGMLGAVGLIRGTIHTPTPDEMMRLALETQDRVGAAGNWVRVAIDVPLAIERAVLSTSVLLIPRCRTIALYRDSSARGMRPVRALCNGSRRNVGAARRELLAGCRKGRRCCGSKGSAFLASGRVVEVHALRCIAAMPTIFAAELAGRPGTRGRATPPAPARSAHDFGGSLAHGRRAPAQKKDTSHVLQPNP